MKKDIIGIIGLGYVGLPLALAFSKKKFVIGFDKDAERINQLKRGIDRNNEFKKELKIKNRNIKFTCKSNLLSECNIYIVTVPTPLTKRNLPYLKLLINACQTLGNYIKKNKIFILESTVYPGCLEEFCVPIIENIKIKIQQRFFCGYSPERVNPGDQNILLRELQK